MRSGDGAGKTVCVTGGSGYIASWIIKLLLQRGYTVKATVRDPNDPIKTEHLRELCGASEQLSLFKAELLDEGSFDSIVNDCEGVFHAASPCYVQAKDPQAELIEPAVKGTLNVLSSCTKSPSVKRVVVTSSMAAVTNNWKLRNPDAVVDETWFSDPEVCKELQNWYALSKTLAEESAWKFTKDHGIDMVSINPAMVIGPLLQPTLNLSSSEILNLINGAKTYSNAAYGWVDVRDVANAHILAFESPSAMGRYCLADKVFHYSEVLKIIRELYPDIQLPTKCATDKPSVQPYRLCTEKARSLGINFTPVRVSLKETVESLKEKKFVNL